MIIAVIGLSLIIGIGPWVMYSCHKDKDIPRYQIVFCMLVILCLALLFSSVFQAERKIMQIYAVNKMHYDP